MIQIPWGAVVDSQTAQSQSYTVWFQATINNGDELFLKAQGQLYLLGAQLVAYAIPSNTVTSPGFIA